jgi:hypothetical protein
MAGFTPIIDDTFNTNHLYILLIICVNIININGTFLITINFVLLKSKVIYAFIFAYLIIIVFINGIIPFNIIIGD